MLHNNANRSTNFNRSWIVILQYGRLLVSSFHILQTSPHIRLPAHLRRVHLQLGARRRRSEALEHPAHHNRNIKAAARAIRIAQHPRPRVLHPLVVIASAQAQPSLRAAARGPAALPLLLLQVLAGVDGAAPRRPHAHAAAAAAAAGAGPRAAGGRGRGRARRRARRAPRRPGPRRRQVRRPRPRRVGAGCLGVPELL